MARTFACLRFAGAFGAALVAAGPLHGEPAKAPTPSEPPGANVDLSDKRLELRGLETGLAISDQQKRKLDDEIARLTAERERLNQALIESTARLQATEQSAAELEARLEKLRSEEETLLKSLNNRRALIGEILLVLQRMGLHSPPALLARPEDILEAIRASMQIGAVLPQMRAETLILQKDLKQLLRLRDDTRSEKEKLAREREDLKKQRANLEPMIDARHQALREQESARDTEVERAKQLAARATSIKDLIAHVESEVDASRRAAQAAREADEAHKAAEEASTREQRARALSSPFRDPGRLSPAVAFADLKGRLPYPAIGQIQRRFGAPDGFGGVEKGLSIEARENAIVIAPSDGWVAFAGPYRSYGQLLILNAGGGYYVVLAGMKRITVDVGQFVISGEPVAMMGDGSARTAATIAIGAKQPILYIEFRKDGTSIDPGPWWARSDMRKVGG